MNNQEDSTLELLLNDLKDENPQIRRAAAFALGKLGDIQAMTPLVNALEDSDSAVRLGVLVA
ncbi:MAG: HEAT repeat domain-containing protein [Anaerolineae bacterium]|jgi:HEAT repeat protein|nr:HEAT repeat domain-containing protein [Anaerolineae bacterium]